MGLGLILSAFILTSWGSTAFWISVISGIIIVTASEIEQAEVFKENWEYWLIAVSGIFVLASALVLQNSLHLFSQMMMIILGGLIAYSAGKQFIANLF